MRRAVVLAFANAIVMLALLGSACAQQELVEVDDTARGGTITTDGNVTSVVNESGSVWGGTAMLEEELSIGVENGPPEYMFGEISSVHADDSGIWVADRQTPAVRLFALDGTHVRDIGGEGEGPGEYTRPELVATTTDGRVFVVDAGTRRINVYATTGEIVEALPLGRGVVWSGSTPMVIDAAGSPWLAYRDYDLMDAAARGAPKFVIRAHSSDGPTGEPRRVPEGQVTRSGSGRFRPSWVCNLTPSGDLLAGGSDIYRFERRSVDGTTTVVEMYWDPVPVSAGEAEYFARLNALRDTAPLVDSSIPDTKPAFLALLGASTGETWVLRRGPGFKVPDCNDHPASLEEAYSADVCWQDELFFDVFGEDCRYLGSVDVLDEMREQLRRWARTPHFISDRVTAVTVDEAGTIMVKRYGLVLPGEEEQ